MGNSKWTVEDMPDQSGRVALVTGANSGIGLEEARALASKGAEVTMACRDRTRGESAAEDIRQGKPKGSVKVEVLDLASLASIRELAESFISSHTRLDLLVNNAGVMMPPAAKTADGFELQIGTNHFGHFALTGLLLELLQKTSGSRVVTVSSMAHKWGQIAFDDINWEARPYKPTASYGQSKLANLLFTYELQRRIEASGAKGPIAVASHPGWTATNLQQHSALFSFFNPFFAMKPWQGALPTLYAATAEDVQGGQYFGPGGFQEARGYPKRVDSSDDSKDLGIARQLWQVSQEATGVPFDLGGN